MAAGDVPPLIANQYVEVRMCYPKRMLGREILIKNQLKKCFTLGNNRLTTLADVIEFCVMEVKGVDGNFSYDAEAIALDKCFKMLHFTSVTFCYDSDKVDRLFGLDEIEQKLTNILNQDCNRLCCLYGPKGCGKGRLVNRLSKMFTDRYFIWFQSYKLIEVKTYLDELREIIQLKRSGCVIFIHRAEELPDEKLAISKLHSFLYDIVYDSTVNVKIIVAVPCKKLLNPSILVLSSANILVRTLNSNERVEFLQYLIEKKTGRSDDVDKEGLAEFGRSLYGFTAKDIVYFITMVSGECADLSLSNLKRMKESKQFLPGDIVNIVANVQSIYWKDIGGYENVKDELKYEIELPLKRGDCIPRGLLLYGPPGCSKTMFVKALATECELNLFSIIPSTIMSKYVGDSEIKLNQILTLAVASAPSIIFIDEIDTLIPDRKSGQDSHVGERLLSELLSFLDGAETKADQKVIFIAATNRRDRLDEALVRPGRINLKIEIGLPDLDAIKAILQIVLTDDKFLVDQMVWENISSIAERLVGKSGANIVEIGHQIKKQARKSDRLSEQPVITLKNFESVVPIPLEVHMQTLSME